ncbi:MAG: hypothetical protein M3Q82_10065, partial [Actinomycetota bacterium]|nr:hypothetical protein [Actinomycetota bacterium]
MAVSATELDLVNAALRRVGARAIAAVSDSTPSGALAGDVVSFEREDLLRAHPWNFATARTGLTRLAATPAFEFEYAYGLPADWLRTVAVHDNDAGLGTLIYKHESVLVSATWTPAILTDAEEVWLRYVRATSDVNIMPSAFRKVLILRLAKIFAINPSNSTTLYQVLDEE